jgi:hypothetical protein
LSNGATTVYLVNNVGIGTSTPTAILDIYGTSSMDIFGVSSSSGSRLMTIASNGSTTISSLGQGIVRSTALGELYTDNSDYLKSISASSIYPTFAYGSSTYATSGSIANFITYDYGTSTYLSKLQAALDYVSTSTLSSTLSSYLTSYNETDPIWMVASSSYLTIANATNTFATISSLNGYLSTTSAASNYVSTSSASSTYLKISDANSSYPTFEYSSSTFQTTLINPITGTGTSSYLAYFTDTGTLNGVATGSDGYVLQASSTSPSGVAYVSTSSLGIVDLPGGVTGGLTYWTSSTSVGAINPGSDGQFLRASSTSVSGYDWYVPALISQWINSGSNIYFNTGNVGIGSSSPSALLSVVVSSTPGTSPFISFNSTTSKIFNILANGKVGIGLAAPTQSLDVAGNINISAGSGYMYNGVNVIRALTGANNYFFANSGNLTMIGNYNIAIGDTALNDVTAGSENIAIGYQTLSNDTGGNYNTGMGVNSLASNTLGSYYTAIGHQSMYYDNGGSASYGSYNSAIGADSLYYNTSGSYNMGSREAVLYYNSTGTYNTASGYNAGSNINDGTANTNSSSSVYIGANTRAQVNNQTNQIVIGAYATGVGSNSVTLGNDSILVTVLKGKIGIGTTTPSSKLDVYGQAGSADIFGVSSSSNIRLFTITNSGKVGIGTSVPSATLSISGTPTTTLLQLVGFGSGSLSTDASGNVVNTSDERLKDIQGSFTRGLADIEQLTPINYKWKPETGLDSSSTYSGFSAQNVQSAIPEAVG